MGTSTPNYHLFKPDTNDLVNVKVDLSDNYDKLDAHAHSGTYERIYNPEAYGVATAGTAAANSAALAACMVDAVAAKGTVQFTGRGPYQVNTQIVIDISKIAFRGSATELTFGSAWAGAGVTGAAVRLINSDITYSGRRFNHRRPLLEGIIITGGGQTTVAPGDGLSIGDPTYPNQALFTVRSCVVEGFTNILVYGDNAWRVYIGDSEFRWGVISVPAGLTNFAENNVFDNCIFADSATVASTIATGQWQIVNCSFDNYPVHQTGPSQVFGRGVHFENPGSTSAAWHCWRIEDDNAAARFTDTEIVVNDIGSAITAPMFYVKDANTTYGLTLDGFTLALQNSSVYDPTLGAEVALVLVGGKGRFELKDWKTNSANAQYIAPGRGQWGGMSNPDFTSSFTGYETGGRGAIAIQSGVVKVAAQAAKLTGTGNNNPELYQFLSCSPGQLLMGGFWLKTDLSGGVGDLHTQIEWYDRRGFLRSSSSFQTVTTTVDWTWHRLGGVAPEGAAFARIVVGTSVTSGTVIGYVDTFMCGNVTGGLPKGGFDPPGPKLTGYVARTGSRVSENAARLAWFTSASPATETLGGALGTPYRKEFVNAGSAAWTIAAGPGDTINGAATLVLNPGESAVLIDSAANAWVANVYASILAVPNHEADSTAVHGITDTSVLETVTGSAAKVAAHEADTTAVHGIADTSLLETIAGAAAQVAAEAALRATAVSLAYFTTQALTTGEEALPREIVNSNAQTNTTGTMRLTYFTARKTETITQVKTFTGGTAAAATPTICRIGIFSVAANGDITLVASTTNDTALWATTNTAYTKSLTASWSKVAGQRYCWGPIIVSAAATPTFPGLAMAGDANAALRTEMGSGPRESGTMSGLADIPTGTTVAASVLNSSVKLYGVFLP